jgi:hypothetical protein
MNDGGGSARGTDQLSYPSVTCVVTNVQVCFAFSLHSMSVAVFH